MIPVIRRTIFLLAAFFSIWSSPCAAEPAAFLMPHHEVSPLIDQTYDLIVKSGMKPDRIFVISPDHFHRAIGKIVLGGNDPKTRELLQESGIQFDDPLTRRDHGVTVHAKRISVLWPDVPLTTMIVSSKTPLAVLLVAAVKLSPLFAKNGLIILSSDLSHYKDVATSNAEDDLTVAALLAQDFRLFGQIKDDCPKGTWLFLKMLDRLNLHRSALIGRTNSGELGGDKSSTTGHASIMYRR